MRPFTNSMATVANRCFRELRFAYFDCRRIPATRQMDIGTVWHAARDEWVKRIDGDALAAMMMVIDASALSVFDRAMLRAVAEGYDGRWRAEQRAQYTLVSVADIERPFRLPLVNPDGGRSRTWERRGVRDVVLYDHESGARVFLESKTTASTIEREGAYMAALVLDSQVSMYADVDGDEPTVCIYDVVRKPGIKPLLATPSDKLKMTKGKDPRPYKGQRDHDETPVEFEARCLEKIADNLNGYYQRAVVTRSPEELQEHQRDLWALGIRIRDAMRDDVWPRNTDACIRFKRLCVYHGVCSGTMSLDSSKFIDTRKHEELPDGHEQTTIGFDGAQADEAA